MRFSRSPVHPMCLRRRCEQVSVHIRMYRVACRETRRSKCRESGPWISSSPGVPIDTDAQYTERDNEKRYASQSALYAERKYLNDDLVEALARGLVLAARHPVRVLPIRVQRPLAALRGLCSEVAFLLDHPDRDLRGVRLGAAGHAVGYRATLGSSGTTAGGAARPGGADSQYGRLHRRSKRGDA